MFNQLAKTVIDNCLQGYNGTIFAYGQTGSGKTFTMSGGDSWEERGIIPRVLSYLFQQFEKFKSQIRFSLAVSYIEIYNENGYDLLEERNGENDFEEWPKITLIEDEDKNFTLKSKSVYECET